MYKINLGLQKGIFVAVWISVRFKMACLEKLAAFLLEMKFKNFKWIKLLQKSKIEIMCRIQRSMPRDT